MNYDSLKLFENEIVRVATDFRTCGYRGILTEYKKGIFHLLCLYPIWDINNYDQHGQPIPFNTNEEFTLIEFSAKDLMSQGVLHEDSGEKTPLFVAYKDELKVTVLR